MSTEQAPPAPAQTEVAPTSTDAPLQGPAVILVSSDEQRIRCSRNAATKMSLLLRDLLDDVPADANDVEMPVQVIRGEVLQVIVNYFETRCKIPPRELERPLPQSLYEVIDQIDADFIRPLNDAMVMEIVVGAGFLNCPSLRDLCCARLAEWVKERNVEEIRRMFGLENDFTPEEEAKLRKEHGLELKK